MSFFSKSSHKYVVFLLSFLLAGFIFSLVFYIKSQFSNPDSKKITEKSEVKTLHIPLLSPDEYVYGSTTSRLMVIEYYDLECPYCRDLHNELIKNSDLMSRIGYVYRPFPLTNIHLGAAQKNLALLCASEQKQPLFLKGMDYAYQDIGMKTIDFESFLSKEVPDPAVFKRCIIQSKYNQTIIDSVTGGRVAGIYGTPSIVFVYDMVPIKVFNLVGGRQTIALIKGFLNSN